MPNKSNLPAEVHDHFQKANLLHTYVQKDLGEASKHALETGQELLAAKATVPHGRWEDECERLFDGSLRTARFYMQFAKDFSRLKTAQKSALLMLEGTLDGAAKAARKAAGGKPAPKRSTPPPDTADQTPFDDGEDGRTESDGTEPEESPTRPPRKGKDRPVDYGKCPNCAGTKWDEDEDGVSCSKCLHPHGEPAGDVDEDRLKTQRQKTVKTAEALMRAFDDLQVMWARTEHDEAIEMCKRLLKLAKGWK